jgi:hypothetical protein
MTARNIPYAPCAYEEVESTGLVAEQQWIRRFSMAGLVARKISKFGLWFLKDRVGSRVLLEAEIIEY